VRRCRDPGCVVDYINRYAQDVVAREFPPSEVTGSKHTATRHALLRLPRGWGAVVEVVGEVVARFEDSDSMSAYVCDGSCNSINTYFGCSWITGFSCPSSFHPFLLLTSPSVPLPRTRPRSARRAHERLVSPCLSPALVPSILLSSWNQHPLAIVHVQYLTASKGWAHDHRAEPLLALIQRKW
jgi:hypothetical protein